MLSFIDDVICWHRDGYLDTGVWNHLQKYVQPQLLPPITAPSGGTTESFITGAAQFLLITEKGTYTIFSKSQEKILNVTAASQALHVATPKHQFFVQMSKAKVS